MDFSHFVSMPIVDGHVHFVHPEYLDAMIALLDQIGCARANLVCIPNRDGTSHNPAALYFRSRYPKRAYISAALEYGPALADPSRAPEALARQVRALRAQGFDGLKLIEGKPEVRKLLPFPLDGPLYAPMWAALEQEQLPVVFHVADPDEFWDPERCPGWARERGWCYHEGGYPSKEALYTEVEHILARHPDLRLIFAHFYFLAHDLDRAAIFLESHPRVCFDLAPHPALYRELSATPVAARQFFLRHQDRLIYGTDLDTRSLGQRGAAERSLATAWLIRAFLENDGPFTMPSSAASFEAHTPYHGLGLPLDALVRIYHTNLERLFGWR